MRSAMQYPVENIKARSSEASKCSARPSNWRFGKNFLSLICCHYELLIETRGIIPDLFWHWMSMNCHTCKYDRMLQLIFESKCHNGMKWRGRPKHFPHHFLYSFPKHQLLASSWDRIVGLMNLFADRIWQFLRSYSLITLICFSQSVKVHKHRYGEVYLIIA